MSNNEPVSADPQQFPSLYERRARASYEDARFEAEALSKAISRLSGGINERSSAASKDLVAGKLFEIANELGSAETAYRRALAAEPEMQEAVARLVVVLAKQRRFDEAIQIGSTLFATAPTAVFKSLVHEGPLSVCTILGDAYRLSANYGVAAGFYREAAKLEGGTPYAVSQAVVSMALAGETKRISDFAQKHSAGNLAERLMSVVRLATNEDDQLATIKQVAARYNIAAAESLFVNRLDLVAF